METRLQTSNLKKLSSKLLDRLSDDLDRIEEDQEIAPKKAKTSGYKRIGFYMFRGILKLQDSR